jgi:hypothetical protein
MTACDSAVALVVPRVKLPGSCLAPPASDRFYASPAASASREIRRVGRGSKTLASGARRACQSAALVLFQSESFQGPATLCEKNLYERNLLPRHRSGVWRMVVHFDSKPSEILVGGFASRKTKVVACFSIARKAPMSKRSTKLKVHGRTGHVNILQRDVEHHIGS